MTLSGSTVALVNPNLVVQRHDMFTTGIVYMPISLAYFGGILRKEGATVHVIDSFGLAPNRCRRQDDLLFRGLSAQDVSQRIPSGTEAIVLYAGQVANHASLVQILQTLKKDHTSTPVIVMENTQAVTAYSLRRVQQEMHDQGADYILTGESERRGVDLLKALLSKAPLSTISQIDGIGFRRDQALHYAAPEGVIADLDTLPYPAWDLFPLQNYWALRYAHGPLSAKRYLPLLTSRGCPYPCRFCMIPETNDRKWRARRAEEVVNEMQYFSEQLGVQEFHIEDVDPTIDDARTRAFCKELLKRRLPVFWKICAGTKVESIKDESTLEIMAKAGCRYISISPESGSERVMQLIGKPFNLGHARNLIRRMNQLAIRSQACFVLGYPGEEEADRHASLALVRDLSRLGVDEIAVFIITPIPGSAIFAQFQGYRDLSQLTFSPSWRTDYATLNRWRQRFYQCFFTNKLIFHPFKIMVQPFRFLRRHFETKMEMVPYRALHTFLLQFLHGH